uniref:Uncharacterized protein n=1 Tax=Utricularia reniformis TaxID=192314 RepID=A0A1Y0B4T2_9LAMI|nr:hypothetical protein AEK19_MT2249 [Utricularia reniformis]ART32394.1 hypothetical protein AEK19_MT2249 [Utricularia reniformis]
MLLISGLTTSPNQRLLTSQSGKDINLHHFSGS